MTRRNFINNIIVAGASFTILPGAGRLWRAKRPPVPAWLPYEIALHKAIAAGVGIRYEAMRLAVENDLPDYPIGGSPTILPGGVLAIIP